MFSRNKGCSMSRLFIPCAISLVCGLGTLSSTFAGEKPNVLVILADDLGYSDLGCYGSEIATPHLDSLARNGLRFTQFYNTARCWPTRAALLTGYYAQQVRRDKVPGIPSGGRGKRPHWAPLLPVRLKPLGYRSYHSGKWHIDGMPIASGFDRSYFLGDQGRFFSPKAHWKDDRRLPPVKRGSGYYATTAIADHAIQCLKDHAKNHADKPFFHYLAFTAPHFPLHALPEDIARYRNTYRKGWKSIREQRWQRQKKQGIAGKVLSKVERDLGPPYHFPKALKILGPGEVNRPLPWDQLTKEQQKFQAEKMAIHAAMIDRMDREIGRVLKQLRSMGAFENTLILFLSDNGASAEIMVRNDGHDPKAAPGSAATHLCLGPGWSTTSNTPFRRHKTWVHEGGIATPFIAHWPKGISAKGELRHTVGHVVDVVPTILSLANGKTENSHSHVRPTEAPPGISLLPAYIRDQPSRKKNLWWLHEGNRAIRSGYWKLVAARDQKWELYDLRTDRAEQNNLAEKYPDKVRELESAWTAQWESIQKLAKRGFKKRPKKKKR